MSRRIPVLALLILLTLFTACESVSPAPSAPTAASTVGPTGIAVLPTSAVVPSEAFPSAAVPSAVVPAAATTPTTTPTAPAPTTPGANGTGTPIAPVTILPPIALVTEAPATPSGFASPTIPSSARIEINPTQGAVSSSVVQITVKGNGFPVGTQVQINVAPLSNGPGEVGQGFAVSAATVKADGTFESAFVMPSDQPDIAQALKIKILAQTADGSRGAEATFTNTEGQAATTPPTDFTDPLFGYRFTIPAGWRARGVGGRVALYNPADKSQPGTEPIIVQAVMSAGSLNGKAVRDMRLDDFIRASPPAVNGASGQPVLKSLQPLQSPAGLSAYQADWQWPGANPVERVITYFDYGRSPGGVYFRTIEISTDPQANRNAEYQAVVSSFSLPEVRQQYGEATRSAVQQFLEAFRTGDNQKALGFLAPPLRSRVAAGDPNLPALLGVQNVPSKVVVSTWGDFTVGSEVRGAAMAFLYFGQEQFLVQFDLVSQGNAWLIDSVVPLQ